MIRLPVSVYTLYADLTDRAWAGSYAELAQAAGVPYRQRKSGREHWYFRFPTVAGQRRPDLYLGPEGPETALRIDEYRALREIRDYRRGITKALRAYGLPGPTVAEGKILSQLAEAGVFSSDALLIGSLARQTYVPLLGVKWGEEPANDDAISILISEERVQELVKQLRAIVPEIAASDTPEGVVIEFVHNRRGKDQTCHQVHFRFKPPAAPRDIAPFDLLGMMPIEAVALYGLGIPVRIPSPEYYAAYDLVGATRRSGDTSPVGAAGPDMSRTYALVRTLLDDRPHEMASAFHDVTARIGGRREDAGNLDRIPEDIRRKLLDMLR